MVADFGQVDEESENCREMFSKYQRQESPKTLYGITAQGDVEVIFQKDKLIMVIAYFFATPIIDYSKLIEAQSKETSPSAYMGKKK